MLETRTALTKTCCFKKLLELHNKEGYPTALKKINILKEKKKEFS
jgi:hypothetical protein